MKRLVLAAVLALSACTAVIPGEPKPDPARPVLPDLSTVDGCSLLSESDFPKPFARPPKRVSGLLGCTWATADEGVWLSVEKESLEQAKVRVREGSELTVEGRKAWWGVETERLGTGPEFSVGIIATELDADRVMLLRSLRTPPSYSVGMAARERSVKVLQRLVP